MSQEKTTLEVIAPTVEEAVQKGLSQLNLPQDAVEVEVLDAGSTWLFGLGSRQARIRLTIKAQPGQIRRTTAPGRSEPVAAAGQPGGRSPAARNEPAALVQPDDRLFQSKMQDETLHVACKVVSDLAGENDGAGTSFSHYRPPKMTVMNRW